MKKLLTAFFLLLSINLVAQPWKTIKGNGEIKKETREISAYTSLFSGGAIDIQIAYGNSNSVTLEADENLLPYIETSVENGRLSIKAKKNVNLQHRSKIIAHVSMTKITSLQVSGSSNIRGDGAFSNDGKTDISISGSGNIYLGFDSFKELRLSTSGSGNINLKRGSVNTIDAKVSGSGNIDCQNIISNDVNAAISGSGNVKVYANNSIDAKISGSGNVFYKGTATNIQSKVAGSGKVMKI